MLPEYDFDYATVVRGTPYRQLLKEGARVARAIRTSEAVNAALRSLFEVVETTRRLTSRSGGRPRARRTMGAR